MHTYPDECSESEVHLQHYAQLNLQPLNACQNTSTHQNWCKLVIRVQSCTVHDVVRIHIDYTVEPLNADTFGTITKVSL